MNTHSESYIAAIHDGVEKLGICGRLTDSPATGTGRFGTLGIWRFTFGRFTLGRLLVKLLQKRQTKRKKKESITVAWELQKSNVTLIIKVKSENMRRLEQRVMHINKTVTVKDSCFTKILRVKRAGDTHVRTALNVAIETSEVIWKLKEK